MMTKMVGCRAHRRFESMNALALWGSQSLDQSTATERRFERMKAGTPPITSSKTFTAAERTTRDCKTPHFTSDM